MNLRIRHQAMALFALAAATAAVATACSSGDQPGQTGTGGSATSSTSSSTNGDGGGATSSTTSVTSSTGSSSSSGGSASACDTAIFCDDFEAQKAAAPPSGKWSTHPSAGAAVVVDTTRAFSGKQSVKLSTAAGDGYKSAMMAFKDAAALPTSDNHVYGRMMFYLESAPTQSVHWTFIDGSGKVPGKDYHAIYRYGGQLPITSGSATGSQLMANYDTPDTYSTPPVGPATDCWNHSDKKVVPVAKWSCVEWEFVGATNEMRFWLDGTELPDLHVTGTGQGCVNQPKDYTWAAPSFSQIDLGWESYQKDDARSIWIDDVVISTQPIGCPKQ